MRGPHTCPGRCGRADIPDRLFACGPCWYRLPRESRRRITSNVRGTVEHAQAMLDAQSWYHAQDAEASR